MLLRRFWIAGAAVVPLALIGVWLTSTRMNPAIAQPGTPPVVHLGLSKNLLGEGSSQPTPPYRCLETGQPRTMQTLTTKLQLRVSSNRPCDEVPNDGTLTCQWTITARTDQGGFGTHDGTFTWKDSAGNVANGTMVGTIGCGTHRPPNLGQCERCRAPLHFEGLLTGRFTAGPLFDKAVSVRGNARVQATYAGQFRGQWPALSNPKGSLDGVYILPCQHH